MTAGVRLEGVSMHFGRTQALRGIDLAIPAGEYAVLLGPSGCGKSTLLGILGGFLAPTAGQVLIDGRDYTRVPPARRPTTTMFQDYALFPHMTLSDNVGFGPRMRGMSRRGRRARALEMLALVGLGDAADRHPHELSGGQRQRAALARALAVEPDVLLLDEPLGALDLKLRRQMQDELKAIQARLGTTFVHVTHDQEEAMAIGDLVVVMNAGRIEDRGPPVQVYMRPRTLFSAGFMGEVNLIPAVVRDVGPEGAAVETEAGAHLLPRSCFERAGAARGQVVTLCIRPEHFREESAQALDLGLGRVEDVAFFGTHVRLHCLSGSRRLVVHVPQGTEVGPGDTISLVADAAKVAVVLGRAQ